MATKKITPAMADVLRMMRDKRKTLRYNKPSRQGKSRARIDMLAFSVVTAAALVERKLIILTDVPNIYKINDAGRAALEAFDEAQKEKPAEPEQVFYRVSWVADYIGDERVRLPEIQRGTLVKHTTKQWHVKWAGQSYVEKYDDQGRSNLYDNPAEAIAFDCEMIQNKLDEAEKTIANCRKRLDRLAELEKSLAEKTP